MNTNQRQFFSFGTCLVFTLQMKPAHDKNVKPKELHQIRPKPNYIIMKTYPIYRLSAFEVTHPFIPGHLIKCGSFMNIYALPLNSLSNFIGLLIHSFIHLFAKSFHIHLWSARYVPGTDDNKPVNEQTSFSSFSVHVYWAFFFSVI